MAYVTRSRALMGCNPDRIRDRDFQIDRRRNQIAADGQRGDDRFDAAAGAEQMAELALGGADGHFLACRRKRVLIARISARSPSGVLVPWALM
jgi:hypothetical protein